MQFGEVVQNFEGGMTPATIALDIYALEVDQDSDTTMTHRAGAEKNRKLLHLLSGGRIILCDNSCNI